MALSLAAAQRALRYYRTLCAKAQKGRDEATIRHLLTRALSSLMPPSIASRRKAARRNSARRRMFRSRATRWATHLSGRKGSAGRTRCRPLSATLRIRRTLRAAALLYAPGISLPLLPQPACPPPIARSHASLTRHSCARRTAGGGGRLGGYHRHATLANAKKGEGSIRLFARASRTPRAEHLGAQPLLSASYHACRQRIVARGRRRTGKNIL